MCTFSLKLKKHAKKKVHFKVSIFKPTAVQLRFPARRSAIKVMQLSEQLTSPNYYAYNIMYDLYTYVTIRER